MTIPSRSTDEVLNKKKRRWLSRLWVRVLLVLLLIGVITAGSWWWPRRTMVAVWRVDGVVLSESDRQRTIRWLNWWDPGGASGLWGNFGVAYRILSCTSSDDEITGVQLKDSHVNDAWLARLRPFPKLKWIGLHDRQLGPGLDGLRDVETLKQLNVFFVSKGHLTELKRVPQLEDLSLWNVQSGELGFDSLTSLPLLKSLFLGDCQNTAELLSALPLLPQVETLVIQDCHGFTDADLANLQRLPNLRYLDIVSSARVSDAGLEHLSKLEKLATFCLRKSSGEFTDIGLQTLQRYPSLRELIMIQGDLTPAQFKSLEQLLPKVRLQW